MVEPRNRHKVKLSLIKAGSWVKTVSGATGIIISDEGDGSISISLDPGSPKQDASGVWQTGKSHIVECKSKRLTYKELLNCKKGV